MVLSYYSLGYSINTTVWTAINIDYDDKQVQDALNRLIRTGQGLSPDLWLIFHRIRSFP